MRDVSPRTIRSDLYSPSAFSDLSPPPSPSSPSVLSVLSSLLDRVVARNERRSPPPSQPTPCPKKLAVFYGSRVPTVSVEQYLERIFKYAKCSPSCFVVAYAYIDRMIQQEPQLRITSLNVHRILITSILVAAKFLDDLYYDNGYYAKIGGITTQEMNKLERDFLFLLDFRLQVTVSVFESYCSHLEREVALGGGYQIEKTLRSICALDGDSNSHEKSERQRVLAVRCYGGL